MFMISRILGVCLLTTMFAASAEARIESVKVTGYGDNYNEAVIDGLKQAVSQISGISITSNDYYQIKSLRISEQKGDVSKDIDNFNEELSSAFKSKLKGVVKRYDILSTDEQGDKTKVRMSVTVERYEAPGQSNETRRRMAVMPFKVVAPPNCRGVNSDSVSNSVVEALTSQLTSSRRFMVLDRVSKDSYDAEEELINDRNTIDSEKIKLGQVRATDYILTGVVRDLKIDSQVKRNPLNNTVIDTRYAGHLILDFKVLLFATRQVKYSSSVSVSKSDFENKGCSQLMDILIKDAAEQAVDMLIDDIYPMIVVKVDTDKKTVFLNMGGDRVQIGQKFTINNLGEELIDPYSGESLGAAEEIVAKIKITQVKPKFSVGFIVEGNAEAIIPGQVCRKVQ